MSCNCNSKYTGRVAAGTTAIQVNTLLIPDTDYVWEVTDAFGSVYIIPFTTDENGFAALSVASLPEGFLNAAMGDFTVRIKETPNSCGYVPMLLASRYESIQIGIVNSSADIDSIGCPFDGVPSDAVVLIV